MSQQLEPESLKHIVDAGFRGGPVRRYHALTKEQRQIMLGAGFLPFEVLEIDQSRNVDFDDRYNRAARRSRLKWVEAMRMVGWTDKEIAARIRKYYRRKKERSPWDFFRDKYGAMTERPKFTAADIKRFTKQRREISRTFGRAYGRIQSVKSHYYRGLPGLPKPKRKPQKT